LSSISRLVYECQNIQIFFTFKSYSLQINFSCNLKIKIPIICGKYKTNNQKTIIRFISRFITLVTCILLCNVLISDALSIMFIIVYYNLSCFIGIWSTDIFITGGRFTVRYLATLHGLISLQWLCVHWIIQSGCINAVMKCAQLCLKQWHSQLFLLRQASSYTSIYVLFWKQRDTSSDQS